MNKKKNPLESNLLQSLIASLICILLGLLIGYIVLLAINPKGAGGAILAVVKNFLTYNKASSRLKYFGNTLVKTAPLLMCALSVQFAYTVGLFNIGAAGQYVAGTCACIYAALAWQWSWLPCLLFAIAAGALFGAAVGLLKAYCNVNEVISGIMLNWIGLYATNMILTNVKEEASPYTLQMHTFGTKALLPSLGLEKLLGGNGKPAPLSRDEYNKMTRRPGKGDSPKRTSVDIQVGTSVRVTDGPLTDFDGKVSEVNTEAGKLKVTLMIFGRETPVELDFNQVAVIA